MRHILLLIIAFFIIQNISLAQSACDVYTSKEVVWYGIDFSHSHFVGQFNNVNEITSYYFKNWNGLFINESEKYNIRRYYKKKSVINELSVVEKLNSQVLADSLIVFNSYSFKQGEVDQIISAYQTPQTSGIGLVFIVESFDKTKDMGFVYVTFFDIATKKVLFTEKVTSPAGGIGFRNFWAKSIFMTLEKSNIKKWHKKYCKK